MVHKTVGCANCKKRKLRCDLSLPGCQRCRKIGKDCPGYPNKWDLAFHNENEVVHAKAWKKMEAVSRYSKRKLSSASPRSPSPQNVFSDDVQLHAICLFFHDYIVESCVGICEGWLDYLPDLFGRHSENSGLHDAVLAAAYANIAQKTARKDLELKATLFYRASLETVKNNLSYPERATSDINMTAVILLGLYECINNTTFFDFSFQHTKGLGVLADLRGSLLHQGKGPTLLQFACCQVNRKNIQFGLHPSPIDERLNSLLDSTSAASRMVMNMFHVSVFSANTLRDKRSGNLDHIWNNSILQNFEKLEQANCQWNEDARIAFPYRIAHHNSGDHRNVDSTSTIEYHTYRGFWSGALWNKHRGAIITLNQALLERLDAAKINAPDGDFTTTNMIELRHKATITIQTMIREVFASIPFSLGDIPPYNTDSLKCKSSTTGLPKSVGGYFLVWPLTVILRCPIASETQRNQARAALIRIGRQFGISHAIKSGQNYMTTADLAFDSRMESLHDSFNRDILTQSAQL
ncbi:hypothetical protein N431DRAFT_96771 [Stipitochalara longipes BDJ]|nr:hypothetical protein N431DRAFT_96771 [Stipitochalara longipes BDJ]